MPARDGTGPTRRLAYAPPPPVHRRRALHRWLAVGLLLIVAATGPKWGPPLWTRGRLLYLQHRCMTYEPPAGQVVADFRSSPPTGVVPADWAAFYALLSPPGGRSSGTVFLHERTSPGGQRRLISVDVTRSGPTVSYTVIRLFVPGSLSVPPHQRVDGAYTLEQSWTTPDLRVYAGSADPADASHFSFDCVENGRPTTYDGWLRDDDRVETERRSPTPAPRPAAPRRTAAP